MIVLNKKINLLKREGTNMIGTENDLMFTIFFIVVTIISCTLLFGFLPSLLINNRKKGTVLMAILALELTRCLVRLFMRFTTLGVIALVIYITFIVMTYFSFRKKSAS